jgi:hypothetical protein
MVLLHRRSSLTRVGRSLEGKTLQPAIMPLKSTRDQNKALAIMPAIVAFVLTVFALAKVSYYQLPGRCQAHACR